MILSGLHRAWSKHPSVVSSAEVIGLGFVLNVALFQRPGLSQLAMQTFVGVIEYFDVQLDYPIRKFKPETGCCNAVVLTLREGGGAVQS